MNSDKAVSILFILIHVVLCLDFGCTRFTKYASIVKIWNRAWLICFAVLYCYCFYNISDMFFHWIAIGGIQTILISFILSHFSDKSSYYKMLNDFSELDLVLGTDVGYYVNVKLVILTIVSILYRIAIELIYCFLEINCFVNEVFPLILINVVCFNVIMVVSSLIFYAAYSRLKVLNKLLRNGYHEVLECLNLYKRIVDSVENTKKGFECVYLIAVVYKIIDLLFMIYAFLSQVRLDHVNITHPFYILVIFNNIACYVLLSSPAIVAGSLTAETGKLQLIIQDRLLQEGSGGQENDLQMFSEYVAARPLQLQLARVLRLDGSLPLLLLNLCISYQIIIVQFTHLF